MEKAVRRKIHAATDTKFAVALQRKFRGEHVAVLVGFALGILGDDSNLFGVKRWESLRKRFLKIKGRHRRFVE